MKKEKQRHSKNGLTLVEVLVAFTLFSLVIGAAISLLTSGIVGQRRMLGEQNIIGEISLTAEYMGRALRQAQKEVNSPVRCLTAVGRGWNYQVMDASNNPAPAGIKIRFLDRQNNCHEFLLQGTQIMESVSTTEDASGLSSPLPLTSSNIQVTRLVFYEEGSEQEVGLNADHRQPRVTLVIEVQDANGSVVSPLRLQTTIAQRVLDIRR